MLLCDHLMCEVVHRAHEQHTSMFATVEFWSAILGAAVGGTAALLAQRWAINAERSKREDDQKRQQKVLARSLLLGVRRIHGNYLALHNYFDDEFATAEKKGFDLAEPWKFLHRLPTAIQPVHFSSEELGLLLEQKHDDVFNATLDQDISHNYFVGAFDKLNEMRAELMDRIPPETVEDDTGRVVLPHPEYNKLRPRMIEINTLVGHLRPEAEAGAVKIGKLLERLSELLRKKLSLPFKVGMRPEPSATVQPPPAS